MTFPDFLSCFLMIFFFNLKVYSMYRVLKNIFVSHCCRLTESGKLCALLINQMAYIQTIWTRAQEPGDNVSYWSILCTFTDLIGIPT